MIVMKGFKILYISLSLINKLWANNLLLFKEFIKHTQFEANYLEFLRELS